MKKRVITGPATTVSATAAVIEIEANGHQVSAAWILIGQCDVILVLSAPYIALRTWGLRMLHRPLQRTVKGYMHEVGTMHDLKAGRRQPRARACKACRKRKMKCDKEHPTCRPCREKLSDCDYTLQPGTSGRAHGRELASASVERVAISRSCTKHSCPFHFLAFNIPTTDAALAPFLRLGLCVRF